ncbi:glycine cleavage system T protein [Myxococcus xanthus DK 1622]|uniref:Glycine cleavage system T protein n=1 Tax=Myxococcus xanthus (strain DK1622) TaxID=246197 RepID=Q1CYQ7_MYXXD|nr:MULTISPECIES: glycine cleavage T C-terminal barrel domain-containing protein [Myxococcus]ABF87273.1 glycine cleavage system T protein [Myxococcus xanthus DK 1622]NOJ52442.1 aminomethyl transferase family protein [Myxococcus xanthus]QPM78691.1 aminomethyl transferase family protein [Myxococcus xanthus]QVW67761.1 aminomethyltransferase family protein [Myxococcus xanthus DZ2]QZZ53966.1 Aminomethyltransferase [Myxococcus xanthus]
MEPLSLHFLHEKAGARFGAVGGRETVAGYGDSEGEYRAAKASVALHDASYRETLRITGEDRASYLHGMVTQEVNNLPVGTAAYAAMVTVKGAMVADARILKREPDLLLDLEPGTGAKVREFLDKYLISEDAELHEATGELALLRLLGPRTEDVLSAALGSPHAPLSHHAARTATLAGQEVWLLGSTAIEPHGVDVWVPRAGLEDAWRALSEAGAAHGLKPLGFEALELLRVEAGVPRYGQDMVDTTIPLEANLANAISYNKGCYIGQEVIARATFRGHMNRKLTGLLLGDADVAPGTELRRGEKKVGWLTSVVQSPVAGQRVALGYVHRDSLEPGTELTLAAGPATVKVASLPFSA